MKNFFVRTLTAIGIVAVQVLCTIYSPNSLAGLFMLFTALSVNEFVAIASRRGEVEVSRPLIIVGSCYLFFAIWLNSLTNCEALILFVPYLAFLMYHFVKELYSKHENPIANLGAIMLSQIYVVLPLSLINVLAFHPFECFANKPADSFYAIPLSIYIFIWINDTGAYLSGITLGRNGKHKLFPRISPKKSWEGSIGGALLTVASAFAVAHFFNFMNIWQWIGMALVVVVFGTFGDLTESMMKRHLGIKDSGHILPGHGGILDRLDSMLLSIPAVVIYLLAISL